MTVCGALMKISFHDRIYVTLIKMRVCFPLSWKTVPLTKSPISGSEGRRALQFRRKAQGKRSADAHLVRKRSLDSRTGNDRANEFPHGEVCNARSSICLGLLSDGAHGSSTRASDALRGYSLGWHGAKTVTWRLGQLYMPVHWGRPK